MKKRFASGLGKHIAGAGIGCLFAVMLTGTVFGLDLGLIAPYQLYQAARSDNDYAAASTHARTLLVASEGQFGEASVELVDPLVLLAEVLALDNQLSEAAEYYQRALKLKGNAIGTGHPDLIPLLDALTNVAIANQNYSEAVELLRRMLDIEKAVYGPKNPQVIITLKRLRDIYVAQDDSSSVAAIESEIEEAEFSERALGFDDDSDGRRYESENGFATVRVFYGTDRARTGDVKPAMFYGGDRGELEMGHLDVTIPETHKYGDLETESQWSVYTYILGEEARKQRYVLLLDVTPLGQGDFQSQLAEHVATSPSKDVFVFVHGYNSSFEDAARRAAQLAYDIDFDGTPMLYSWPSQASTGAYTVDEAVVRLSGQRMSRFLEGIVAESGADRIHLIAHSMGNRALVEALQAYSARRGESQSEKPFDQIIFTAPDVDRDYFLEVFDAIEEMGERVTLYASENDVALKSSRILHGAPRAGQAGPGMISHPGLDSIDMSALKADFLGHTYFAVNQGAILDLFRLFWRGEAPTQRCGMMSNRDSETLWAFTADSCKGADRLEANVLLKRFGQPATSLVQDHIDALTDTEDEATRQEWQQILDRLNELVAEESP